ncbi:Myb-like transcription factor [Aspergillus eucalypticola CBS 122712]|uniref:Myb-like transcription factor n=1 Tax=Aspergillus eucalypticola (strain CBS 122712 / IBT 29274) TaxID=1448314 RepID=A0A317W0I3_ASPEC|nr:Myb-like transcription factor [Aspergillus eucalypticola CBS 122712]PWY80013.1 Myb-like transcription factor [Aspergillus eucalypticola CBS 122712]
MSATLADPYREYAIDYSQHATCKPEEHAGTLVYHAQQPHLQHHKQSEPPFSQGASHSTTAFEQHHANATVLSTATPQQTVHDISQSVVLGPPQMLPRHLPVQYPPASFEIPPIQREKKRPHSETEEDGNPDHGLRPQLSVLSADAPHEPSHSPEMLFGVHGTSSQQHPMSNHGFGPTDSVALPQHHHHHRLPPHAALRAPGRHGVNVESPPLPSGPPSVLKENKNLTWKQIADFFPGRTSGTLQVRYCTKLKAKDVAWSDEMVQRLQRAMHEYENDRWRIIAGKVGNGFTPAACREKAMQLQ